MNKTKQLLIIIAFAISITGLPVLAEDHDSPLNTPQTETIDTEQNDTTDSEQTEKSGTYIKAGGLCVGGAILGSFIPILGNLVGCAVGATAGYFWGRSSSSPDTTSEPEAVVLDT